MPVCLSPSVSFITYSTLDNLGYVSVPYFPLLKNTTDNGYEQINEIIHVNHLKL